MKRLSPGKQEKRQKYEEEVVKVNCSAFDVIWKNKTNFNFRALIFKVLGNFTKCPAKNWSISIMLNAIGIDLVQIFKFYANGDEIRVAIRDFVS